MHTKFWRATAVRCARTFLTTLLGVWTGGQLITEVDWKTALISAVSATVYIFITCLVAGLPEVDIEPTDFEKALLANGIDMLDSDDPPEGIGGSYTPRLKEPSTSDKNWIHTSKGGYNSCILIKGNSVLPNCVGYAWGRWRELLGKAPALSRMNAEDWWAYKDGYKRGQTPKLGAVACWRKGKAGYGADGAGHVAIVENIAADGTVTFSQSGYGYKRFYITKMKKNFNLGGTYVFQGFIYPPESATKGETTNTTTTTKTKTYKVVCKDGMKIRSKASTSGKVIGTIAYGLSFKSSKQSGDWAYYDAKKGWVCIKSGKETYLKAQ